MDVNRSEPLAPVHDREPRRDQHKRHNNEETGDGKGNETGRHAVHAQPWSDDDAVDLGNSINRISSPEAREVLETLASRMEPLQQELERARERETMLRHQLDQHPYLPVLNRMGMEHEVTRVAGCLSHNGDDAESGPKFVCVTIRNAPDIRLKYGRAAYDQAMRGACDILKNIFSEDDIFGCLGGDDLGIVVLDLGADGQYITNETLCARIREEFGVSPVDAGPTRMRLEIEVGSCSLRDHATFAEALASADARLIHSDDV